MTTAATSQAATDPTFGPDLARGDRSPGDAGDPGFVQLLTPEGERVHHPDYDVDLDEWFCEPFCFECEESGVELRIRRESTSPNDVRCLPCVRS